MVILILASVSIAMLTGENGILTKATTAKEKTAEGQKNEEQQLTNLENKLDEYETITSRNYSNDYDVLWDWETKDENGNVTQTVKNSGSITLNNSIENYKYLVVFAKCYNDIYGGWVNQFNTIVPSYVTDNKNCYGISFFQWNNAGCTLSFGFLSNKTLDINNYNVGWYTNTSITQVWGMK